jgi:hypothetical protein
MSWLDNLKISEQVAEIQTATQEVGKFLATARAA